jgi:hypothetical protein
MHSQNVRPRMPRWIRVVFAVSIGACAALACGGEPAPVASDNEPGGALGDLYPLPCSPSSPRTRPDDPPRAGCSGLDGIRD